MEYFLGSMSGERLQKKPDAPIGARGLTHTCPFCGKRASQGRVINWIASECILDGEAVFPCSSCGQTVSAPSAIFVEESLRKLSEKNFDPTTGRLNQRGLYLDIIKMSARELLVPNWGEVLEAWNKRIRS